MASRRAPLYTAPDRAGVFAACATNNESDKALSMSGFKEPNFADRQKAAQQARQDILNKFRNQPGPDDPAVMQRRAEREAPAARRARRRRGGAQRQNSRARPQRPSRNALKRKPPYKPQLNSPAKRKKRQHGKRHSKPNARPHAMRAVPPARSEDSWPRRSVARLRPHEKTLIKTGPPRPGRA